MNAIFVKWIIVACLLGDYNLQHLLRFQMGKVWPSNQKKWDDNFQLRFVTCSHK